MDGNTIVFCQQIKKLVTNHLTILGLGVKGLMRNKRNSFPSFFPVINFRLICTTSKKFPFVPTNSLYLFMSSDRLYPEENRLRFVIFSFFNLCLHPSSLAYSMHEILSRLALLTVLISDYLLIAFTSHTV